jgi:hypothetical protein
LDVPSTGPSDVPSTGPSDAEPSTCTSLSASAASSTSKKSGHIDSDGSTAPPWTPFFVYFRDDGEHIDSDDPTAHPWTQFEAGTGKKNHELQVQNHDLQAHHEQLSDTSGKKIPRSGDPQSECTTPSLVYFRNDGEHIDSDGPMAPPWTQFEVTLKDENKNPRLYSKGDPITVIAPPPSEIQGWVFLTHTQRYIAASIHPHRYQNHCRQRPHHARHL